MKNAKKMFCNFFAYLMRKPVCKILIRWIRKNMQDPRGKCQPKTVYKKSFALKPKSDLLKKRDD